MRILFLTLAAVAMTACSQPSVATCSQNADCPPNAICISGICQKGVPSGGSAAPVGGAARIGAGTITMDVTVGQPMAPAASAGTIKLSPAENTR
jgi:hypothetical protein